MLVARDPLAEVEAWLEDMLRKAEAKGEPSPRVRVAVREAPGRAPKVIDSEVSPQPGESMGDAVLRIASGQGDVHAVVAEAASTNGTRLGRMPLPRTLGDGGASAELERVQAQGLALSHQAAHQSTQMHLRGAERIQARLEVQNDRLWDQAERLREELRAAREELAALHRAEREEDRRDAETAAKRERWTKALGTLADGARPGLQAAGTVGAAWLARSLGLAVPGHAGAASERAGAAGADSGNGAGAAGPDSGNGAGAAGADSGSGAGAAGADSGNARVAGAAGATRGRESEAPVEDAEDEAEIPLPTRDEAAELLRRLLVSVRGLLEMYPDLAPELLPDVVGALPAELRAKVEPLMGLLLSPEKKSA